MTVQQAYGGTSLGVVLDARVADSAKEEEKTALPSPTVRAPLPPAPASAVEGKVFAPPDHPGSKLVDEDRHDEELQCKICAFCLDRGVALLRKLDMPKLSS
jgi:hypothetical protein